MGPWCCAFGFWQVGRTIPVWNTFIGYHCSHSFVQHCRGLFLLSFCLSLPLLFCSRYENILFLNPMFTSLTICISFFYGLYPQQSGLLEVHELSQCDLPRGHNEIDMWVFLWSYSWGLLLSMISRALREIEQWVCRCPLFSPQFSRLFCCMHSLLLYLVWVSSISCSNLCCSHCQWHLELILQSGFAWDPLM